MTLVSKLAVKSNQTVSTNPVSQMEFPVLGQTVEYVSSYIFSPHTYNSKKVFKQIMVFLNSNGHLLLLRQESTGDSLAPGTPPVLGYAHIVF